MVKVPRKVFMELELIRSSGDVNMLDVPAVIRCAEHRGMKLAATWVQDNKKQYWEGVISGFQAE